ncbi:TetR/AcrR family transcriptional regulator [Streptomyces sp. Tu102]|uniref:TetR/AcrR family transcriptional regulator n=1 Tax=Streptomyces TaxID=1883 RepID=UPI001BDC8280|nr:TetR/AcrR family transcriptional regulator [Streptomyces sp. Tu102]MBT1098046.1 TetR/AcrR family transcriptional regulator [Streptomyces sp. Tu102]
MQQRPKPGTRPANRRSLILEAATALFAVRGYEHVSISDIAAEVAVGPSALYRHFPGKEQLLAEVIGQVADEFTAMLAERAGEAADSEEAGATDILTVCAAFTLDHRSTGVLFEREARHLSPDTYATVLARIRAARSAFAAAVTRSVPDTDPTTARAALSVILSPSFHRTSLPRPAYDRHLAALAGRTLAAALPPAPGPAVEPTGLRRSSTRDALVTAAVRLFADRTYTGTGMEDVAAAVGMAPSSLYNHLPNKSDVLLTALTRADGYLQLTLDGILARSSDAMSALGSLVDSYAAFAVQFPALVDVLVTEVRNLPGESAEALQKAQREFIGEWVHLLRQSHPDLDLPTARVTVQAALMMINDMSRSPGLRSRSDAVPALSRLGRAVLSAPTVNE